MNVRTETVWYAEGLAFECRACGRCCRGPGGFVWVTEAEIQSLAAALALSPAAFARQYVRSTTRGYALRDNGQGDCILLDEDNRCRAYDVRPLQCRTYPWWPEVVDKPSYWRNEQRHCPGIGDGRVHAAQEIQEALARVPPDPDAGE